MQKWRKSWSSEISTQEAKKILKAFFFKKKNFAQERMNQSCQEGKTEWISQLLSKHIRRKASIKTIVALRKANNLE